MKEYKITIEDLAFLLNDVKNRHSSSESDDFYTKSPRHIILYNEILKFSKEELESLIKHNRSEIWDEIFYSSRPNPLLFSALIQKGAFINLLSKEGQSLLNYLKEDSSIEFYNLILQIEKTPNMAFAPIVCRFLYALETKEKQELLEPLYRKYLDLSHSPNEKKISEIIEFCFNNPLAPLATYLLKKIEENNIDLNQNFNLNRFIQYDFISSTDIPRIAEKLKFGFRFDEKNYVYKKRESLFTSIIKSGRKDVIETIIPYLSEIKPFTGTQEEQTDIVESLRNSKDIYDIVAPYYYKLLLEKKLSSKEHVNKRKI